MMKLVIFALVVACAFAIPGGWYDVDNDDESVVEAAQFASLALGNHFLSPYHTKLHTVHEAKQQVVAGMNFKLTITVGLTNCKKAEVDYNEIDTCEFKTGGSIYRKCEVVVYRNLKGEFKLTSSGCTSIVE